MSDQRPEYTISPHQDIYTAHGDAILDHMRAAFDEVIARGGNPDEVINDALSILAELASSASVLFLAKLGEAKKAPGVVIWSLGVVDLQNRMIKHINTLGEWLSATKQ